MIISASRRTDIPAFYADWFFRRMEAGFVCTRNPMNPRQVSRISLSPGVVDGFVFWTKNPIPMMDRLPLLQSYPFYFQFTLTPYGKDMEPGLPDKHSVLIPAFQQLSRRIGAERVIWRYDPIVLTPACSMEYHVDAFAAMAAQLSGYTEKCVISFLDMYRHLGSAAGQLGFLPMDVRQMHLLAERFSEIARREHLILETCAESIDLSRFGISHGHCIDGKLFQRLLGQPLEWSKDKNQRPECGCMASIDIGMYDSCANGCRYCYANHSVAAVQRNIRSHDPGSPLLYGQIRPEDTVTDRPAASCKITQSSFF